MKKKLLCALIALPLVLGSCSTKYDARQGLNKYKDGFTTQLEALKKVEGSSNVNVSFGECKYVLLDKDSNTTGDNIYYYQVQVTTLVNGISSMPETDYFSWTKGDKCIESCTKEIFEYIYTAVSEERLPGECGTC